MPESYARAGGIIRDVRNPLVLSLLLTHYMFTPRPPGLPLRDYMNTRPLARPAAFAVAIALFTPGVATRNVISGALIEVALDVE